jgi:hypothetical protein
MDNLLAKKIAILEAEIHASLLQETALQIRRNRMRAALDELYRTKAASTAKDTRDPS